MSSDDWYDDSTNVHKNRHFHVFLPDKTEFKDIPVSHRGYSALSYCSKPDRRDSLMSDWHRDRKSERDQHYATVFSPKDLVKMLDYDKFDGKHLDFYGIYDDISKVPRDNRKLLTDADSYQLKNYIKFLLKRGVPAESRRDRLIIPVVASTNDSDIVRLHDLWKGYDPGRDNLNEVQTRHIYDKYVPKNWIKYYSFQDLHDSIDNLRYDARYGKVKPDGNTGIEHFDSILDLINEALPNVLPGSLPLYDIHELFVYNQMSDILHNIINEIKREHPELSNRIPMYAPYTVDKLLHEDFPYENKRGKTPTLSDRHYKQIISDLYDDIQANNTQSNIADTLEGIKYV